MNSEIINNSLKVEQEKLNNQEVITYLRSIETEFMEQLEEFGKKAERGFETIKNEIKVDDYGGKFTGSSLCKIGSSAIEEGLKIRFGNNIIISSFSITTTDMDINQEKTIDERNPRRHFITRFKTINDDNWITVDPTYCQFQNKINPKTILIFPTKNEEKIYTYKALFDYYNSSDTAEESEYFFVQQIESGKNYKQILDKIKSKHYGNATENDYQKLINIFSV